MPTTTTSPNMLMPLPIPGSDPGPDWATNLYNSLLIVDQHTHANGSGVQITPAGLNINSDLTMANNNLIALRTARFQVQSSAPALTADKGCLYVTGVDLYFKDVSGNAVRITQSGGVAGSPGSISNLTSPASATYVSGSQTFVWQSAALTPANMDGGSVILRNVSASSYGLTLSPPAAMGANFAITLPSLPAATKIVRMDSSGNLTAALDVDNSTIEISANALQIKDLGVTTAKINDLAVTNGKIANATIVLTTKVTGTLPVLNGGTGVTTSTGSGNNVLSASPTLTGTIGAAAMTLSGTLGVTGAMTGTSLALSTTLSVTGAITGSALTLSGLMQSATATFTTGINGVTSGVASLAGYVGEYMESSLLTGSAQSLPNGAARTITSIDLTAGDWDISGAVNFGGSPTGTTAQLAGISTTNNSFSTSTLGVTYFQVTGTLADTKEVITLPRIRVLVSGATTIYLVAQANFTGGTSNGFGTINARRVR